MKKLKLILIILIALMLNNCSSVPGTGKGDIAPDFKLKDIHAQPKQLSGYRGKVVLLHFWTDWCNACRAEFPRIQDYYAELKSDDFEIIAVNVGQPMSVSLDFKQSFGVTFQMLTDTEKAVGELYDVEAYPTNYFIGPDGKVIKKYIGWVSKKQVEVIINQHKDVVKLSAKQ